MKSVPSKIFDTAKIRRKTLGTIAVIALTIGSTTHASRINVYDDVYIDLRSKGTMGLDQVTINVLLDYEEISSAMMFGSLKLIGQYLIVAIQSINQMELLGITAGWEKVVQPKNLGLVKAGTVYHTITSSFLRTCAHQVHDIYTRLIGISFSSLRNLRIKPLHCKQY